MKFRDRVASAYRLLTSSSTIDDIYNDMPTDIEKGESTREMKANVEDPFGLTQAMGYKDKQFSISYDVLRRMASKDAVIGSIITTRVNQVSSYTSPSRFNSSGIGYEIRMRNTEKEVSEADEENIIAIENFLENTGYDINSERDSFDTFIRKIVRDRLTYDQIAFEIVPDRLGRPAEFHAVDGSTIRIATESLQKDAEGVGHISNKEEVKYVQVIQGRIQAYFTHEELAFGVANPRTDINVSGYGYAELEMLVHQVTSHLWAEEYNSRFFSQGGTTKGILNLKSQSDNPISPHQLESFKRQWLSQVSGMTGAWKTPVLSVEGLEYINVSQSNREMEFEKWMNYLINIVCGVFQIDPSEINFPNRGGAGGSGGGGLGDGGISDRLAHSKDKGLRPLLRHIESLVNKHIVAKFDNRYIFAFVGIDSKSEKEALDIIRAEISTFKTVNEVRADQGLPDLDGGDIILDAQFTQHLSQMKQAEMMQGMQGGGGEEEEDDDGGYGDGDDSGYGDPDDTDDDEGNVYTDGDDEEDDDMEKSLTNETKFLTIEIED